MESVERWAPIFGHDGYEASDIGRIRSVDRIVETSNGPRRYRGRVLRIRPIGPRGYMGTPVRRNGRLMTLYVHRAVLLAFVGPPPDGMEGCHNNGNHLDNRLENLRWDTSSANKRDMLAHGTHNMASRTHCVNGHEFTPDNLYKSRVTKEGWVSRRCKTCALEKNRESRRRQRQAA